MGDYKCFACQNEFPDEKSIFAHLKFVHSCKNNTDAMKCVINYKNKKPCEKTFMSFSGLRKHLRICLKAREDDVHSDTSGCELDEPNSLVRVETLLESFRGQLSIHEQVKTYMHDLACTLHMHIEFVR